MDSGHTIFENLGNLGDIVFIGTNGARMNFIARRSSINKHTFLLNDDVQ
jgi:hypothetical protein